MNIKHTVVAGLLLVALGGCGSATDSATGFVESGKSLVAEGNIGKARLEFKNAIQIDPRLAEPFYQLALLDEKEQNWKGMYANLVTVEQLDPNNHAAIVKLGQVYLLSGNLELALEKADGVLAVDQSNSAAWVLRSSILMKQQNLIAALEDIEQALSLNTSVEALSVKALIFNQQGKPEQAIEIIDEALKIEPGQLPVTMIKLSIFEGQKDYQAVEGIYNGLLEDRPDESWVTIALAKLYHTQNRPDEAQQVLEEYISKHSDNKQIKLLLVDLIKLEEPKKAMSLLDEYIELDKENYDLYFSKVTIQMHMGDTEAAIAGLKNIASLDSEGSSGRKAMVTLAGFDFQQGNISSAEEKLKKVLLAAPESEIALLLMSQIDVKNKNFDEALTGLRVILRNNPESDQALVLLAQAYMLSGSSELADDNFRQALTVNPGNNIAALSVASGMMKQNDLNRTEEVLTAALEKSKVKTPLLQALAQVKILKRDWLGTETVIESLRVDKKDTAVTYYLSGQISQGQSNYESAVQEYAAALELRPDMVRALQGLAFAYLELGQKAELLAYLETYIDNNEQQLAGYAVLSNLYLRDKDWENAISSLEKGLDLEPKWQDGYSALASVYLSQNEIDKAIATYQKGIDKNGNSNFLMLQMAAAYERSGNFDKAKSLYEEVLTNDPSIEPAINNLASLLTDQFSSEQNINKAMDLAGGFKTATEPYYLDTYAWTNVLLGDYEEAQGILERVVSLSPDVTVFNYHLGALYLKQGNTLGAETYLNKAHSLAEQEGDVVMVNKVIELLDEIK